MIGFSPEGPTDERFLGSVIQRTAIELLHQHGRSQVDVLPPISFPRPKDVHDGGEKLLAVARQTYGYHCLIIHADADDSSYIRALNERIEPGKRLINADSKACQEIVPLIPVHMSESWMLVDSDALTEALNTDLDLADLGIPKPKFSERPADPKQLLKDAVRISQEKSTKRRRSQIHISDLYAELADISLDKLMILPSYQQFRDNLLAAFRHLQLVD